MGKLRQARAFLRSWTKGGEGSPSNAARAEMRRQIESSARRRNSRPQDTPEAQKARLERANERRRARAAKKKG